MASLLFYLSATVLFAQSTVAFNCSKAPIYVDIHKRAVHDSPVFQYGSFIGIGMPAQNHSLWPSLSHNHTSFASLNYCGNSTFKDCQNSTGGFFSNKDSTSFSEQKDFQSQDNNNGSLEGFFGQDVLRLYTHYFETDGASQTLVEGSTVEVIEEGSIKPGIVGIGGSSTLLRDLAGKNMIAGKTYSLYLGQGYDRAGGAVNGSNVFGGYDSGRFKGPVHKYNMNINRMNPMTLKVKDIIISGTNDKINVSLFDPSVFTDMKSAPAPFEAEITTDQFPLSLPYQITQNFMTHLNAEKDNTWGDNSLKLKEAFNGTLSIVLDDGFTVTLPSEILSNKSNITPIQSREQDSTTPFYLSAAFLTQVYLMADFDTNVFYLADAVQKNNMVMPVTFCPKTVPEPYSPPNQSPWVKQGLIGAVVGGVFGTLGVGVCLYCFYLALLRRRQERKLKCDLENMRRAKMEQMEVDDKVPEFDPPPKSATPFFWKKR